LIRKLAAHLEETGVLAERRVDQPTFTAKFGAPDDLEFIEFIAASRSLPVPPSVRTLSRTNAHKLFRKVGGLCLLYRLGTELRRESAKDGFFTRERPVLRRIPVAIEDINESHLLYKDSYGWYDADFEVLSAAGSMFLIHDHFTIFAEDIEDGGISELFLAEIGQEPMKVKGDTGGNLYKGVIVMKGDTAVPTACKVLLRRAAKAMQEEWANCRSEQDWQALARTLERKFYLQDNDEDGRFELAAEQNSKSAVETTDSEPFSGLPYSWYANELQIRPLKLDIR
jgi:hypothetical protein